MKLRSYMGVLAVGCALAACGSLQSREAAYLNESRGRATQTEVREHLGAPQTTRTVESGDTIWIYEKREQQAGNRYSAPGTWCEQFLLTFDKQSVLQQWTQRTDFQGGEVMPAVCFPDSATSK
ncbi:MAG: hypothetical protein KF814_01355 [Nitrospiraceae bacterium]|nr:hypothetical protein [Nitrospiraceae bacterium]